MDIVTFMDYVNAYDVVVSFLQTTINRIVDEKLPTKRRTIIMKGVNQPFQIFNYIEEFVPEFRTRNHLIYPGTPVSLSGSTCLGFPTKQP